MASRSGFRCDCVLHHSADLPAFLIRRLSSRAWWGLAARLLFGGHDGGDLELILEADGVLDQAGGEGVFEDAELAIGEPGRGDFHSETAEVERAGRGLGEDANGETFGRESARGKVLRDVLTDAAAEGGKEEFRRRHALVRSAVFDGLVEDHAMMTSFGGEARSAVMVQRNFQETLRGLQGEMQAKGHAGQGLKQDRTGKKASPCVGYMRHQAPGERVVREMTQQMPGVSGRGYTISLFPQ